MMHLMTAKIYIHAVYSKALNKIVLKNYEECHYDINAFFILFWKYGHSGIF